MGFFIGNRKKMLLMLSLVLTLKQQINECNSIELINGTSLRNRDQKSNLLFLKRHDQSKKL